MIGLVFVKFPAFNINRIDSFIIYICLDGSFTITYKGEQEMEVSKGETVLLPASLNNIKLIPGDSAELLEVYVP